MSFEFSKTYLPKDAESKWYDNWQNRKIYKADPKSGKKPYSILMPPPNVTGILHFGHVLNNTLQDIYIRYNRMRGKEVCWFPGTDHAGIATQTKVEQELRKEKLTRYDLGREKFLEKVWEWKEKYGGIILKQLRYLGVSADWDRTLFTMDESASNAVKETFIRLFDEGLIYRGKRIINWSPLAQSALSDEEVEFREVKGKFYTMRYYYEDGSGYMQLSTVRPETIFGDVAVAVNAKDERYADKIGKMVRVPLVNRLIPIITDDYADPTFGTGAVKITPAHDPNDFEVGRRHNLEAINTINPDATMNELAGEFCGLDRFEARKRVVAKLEELELMEKIEDYTHNVGYSQRGGEQVEPYLSDQWFVNMAPLAKPALDVVRDGQVKFHPAHWEKTYENWLTNVRDWCISRQLWWGHRIPVYYAEDGTFTAARNAEEACQKLGLPANSPLRQDTDVLDTWFSSWLWPMTTMHWLHDGKTEHTDDMDFFLPTDLLVTAPDIIFFWVARMIMASLHFKGTIPFKDVYFTSTIRDGQGRKLSKSLGNSPDPIEVIAKYGTDAVRFTSVYLAPLGQDLKMDVDVKKQDIPAMEIGRNFANKIWNAGRFLWMKAQDNPNPNPSDNSELAEFTVADKWILSRLHSSVKNTIASLDAFRVNEFSKNIYDFIWRDFCDWYVEIVKIQLNNSDDAAYRHKLAKFALKQFEMALKLLHPIVPFITEELWHQLGERSDDESISTEAYPEIDENMIDENIEKKFEYLQTVVEEIRKLKTSVNLAPQDKVPVLIAPSDLETKAFIDSHVSVLSALGKVSDVKAEMDAVKPELSAASVVSGSTIYIILEGKIDIEKERERLTKEKTRLENLIRSCSNKLNNEKFVAGASLEVVQNERKKLSDSQESLAKVEDGLNSL